MVLILTIEGETSLPNGAPISVTVMEGSGLDIGRSAQLGWSLPDASRFISGKHCEVRYRDGGYWLYDVSTNGTFLNDDPYRMQAPHRLRDGDRIAIGDYEILATVEGEQVDQEPARDPERDEPPPPYVTTEVAPRAAASAFGLELERPANNAPSSIAPAPSAEDAPARTPAVFRPLRRTPGPVAVPPIDSFETPYRRSAGDSVDAAPAAATLDLTKPSAAGESAVSTAVEAPLPSLGSHGQTADDLSPAAPPASLPEKTSPPRADMPAGFASPPADAADAAAFVRRFAQSAGIAEHILARRDPLDLADDLGELFYLVTDNLKQLLNARREAKRFTRASSQTVIQALDNNPLKFAPTVEDALKIMLGPRTKSYLEAQPAFEAAFKDLKTHQIKTFSAMQGAVKMLVEDLDPAQIEAAANSEEGGLSGWLGNRKGRFWDIFLARWQAKNRHRADGLVDAFMLYFAECYDRAED